jgi:hypothetical protein
MVIFVGSIYLFSMLPLSFPQPNFSLRKQEEQPQIFDPLRKLWVKLTPEEWVRQNMICMLQDKLNIPTGFMGVEKEIQVGAMKKRFDLLIFDRNHQPWMLIECKSEKVSLKESTAEQLLRYYQVLRVRYLIITNGEMALGWHNQLDNFLPMLQWPQWDQ